jgi:hypothetical protein
MRAFDDDDDGGVGDLREKLKKRREERAAEVGGDAPMTSMDAEQAHAVVASPVAPKADLARSAIAAAINQRAAEEGDAEMK